jgi:hypothetical protein
MLDDLQQLAVLAGHHILRNLSKLFLFTNLLSFVLFVLCYNIVFIIFFIIIDNLFLLCFRQTSQFFFSIRDVPFSVVFINERR